MAFKGIHFPSTWARKPLAVVMGEESKRQSLHTDIPRHFTLFDLVCLGVGGTIGSGVFVLIGFVANVYAGPATIISFAVSGFAAICSGVCYAEISSRIPVSGSAYMYSYICLGELPAVLAASCLSLEYGISASAVARSWGSKCVAWFENQLGWTDAESYFIFNNINIMALICSSVCVILLSYGIKESKSFSNIFSVFKCGVVLFATVGGLA